MNLSEMIGVAIIGKILGDLFGNGKKPTETKPAPPPPASPAPPPASAEPAPPKEPKPLPSKPTDIKWPDPSRYPADFKPPMVVDPATGLNEPAGATVPTSRQPNKGKPEPVYVPPQPTKSPDIHKGSGGYVPPQPQVKQQKGEAVSQTEEAAVIARERNPTSAYWMPAKRLTQREIDAAKEMTKH